MKGGVLKMVYVNVPGIIIVITILIVLGIVVFLISRDLCNSYKEQPYFKEKTELVFPILRDFGEFIKYDREETIEENGLECKVLFDVSVYDSWRGGFYGHILKIKNPVIQGDLFCRSVHNFMNIRPESYQEAKRINMESLFEINPFKCYTVDGILTNEQYSLVLFYKKWIDENIANVFSYSYAIYFRNGEVQVFFDDRLDVDELRHSNDYRKERLEKSFNTLGQFEMTKK